MELKMTTDKKETELTIQLSGEINALTAPNLSELLEQEMSGVKTLTFDFIECDYVSSAGLRVLLATFKEIKAANGTMRLINVGENFMDVLSNTNLDAVFDITRKEQ